MLQLIAVILIIIISISYIAYRTYKAISEEKADVMAARAVH